MTLDNFAAFILSHGRANKVKTLNTLRRSGYTGRVYIIIDNEDGTAQDYIETFGSENVIMFDKLAVSKTFDTADNFDNRKTIVFARNACFQIAKDLGVEYFVQLDDDYSSFDYRVNDKYEYIHSRISNLDNIFSLLVQFLVTSKIKTIAMSQGGDFLGGEGGGEAKGLKAKRKAMNSFVCKTDNPITFLGRINEDVNTYTRMGSIGDVYLQTPLLSLNQAQTQSSAGGMTETYIDGGTYVKSFYTVIFMPSSVKISMMRSKSSRIHHRVSWRNTVPKIISEFYRKTVE